MKNILKVLFVLVALFGIKVTAYAEDPATVNLTIRDENIILFSGTIPLHLEETISLNDTDGSPRDINANSVLSIVHDADTLSDGFSISNLTYFGSFGSLYLKCIFDSKGENCDNWQYVVDGSYPFVGMDQNILSGGESIYLYFGPQNKIILSGDNISTSDDLSVTTQSYDYENDGWTKRTGVTVGITQPDPSNPFSPIEISTSSVDANGIANFSSIGEGTYDVGVKEDFYFPTEKLNVTTKTSSSTSKSRKGNSKSSTSTSVGTVLGVSDSKIKFDQEKAFEFLISKQNIDGDFGEDIYTDWTTLAFVGSNQYQNQIIKLVKYLSLNKTSGTLLTDYERRAMTLMSLGLNPYNNNETNYINKIVSKFDGRQFGDPIEDNDDIFALIVLENAGYDRNEKMIMDDVSFVLSRQKENGSWDESIDMTGAAMVALNFTEQSEGIKNAIAKAKDFLKKNQKDDGGWSNVSSTAWAIEGILSIPEKPEEWIKNDNNPLDYLAVNQDTDGGIKNINEKNKIWETAYTLTALSGKTWKEIMQKYEKPKTDLVEMPKKSARIAVKTAGPQKSLEKVENIASQNTANVLTTTDDQPVSKDQPKKRKWLGRIIDNFIGIFF